MGNVKLLLSLVCALLLSACQGDDSVADKIDDARSRNDGPALWKVTDHNSTLYLFGTVHLLPEGLNWQRRDMRAAFDEVGTVFFEIPDDGKAALDASIYQRQYGVYESGKRLSDHLDAINYKRLTAAAYNVNVPPQQLELFKPWLVADLLSIAAAEQAGLKAAHSADSHLRAKAKAARKSIKYLDDMRSYIEAVALQPDWVQLQSLEQTITNFGDVATDIRKVNAAWLVGNIELLERDLIMPVKANFPQMYDALFADRNKKWSRTLDGFLQGDSNAMAVIGIGHMIGEDSLIVQLKELGYETRRVRRYDLPNN